MITKDQLDEAIAEMQGQLHPNADTCLKLASYYTIKNELFPEQEPKPQIERSYSFDPPPTEPDDTIGYSSETDFGRSVNGRKSHDVMQRIDEVMSALYVINPPLYKRILRELEDI